MPDPLRPAGATVRYQCVGMPDGTGLGDDTGSGQAIAVRLPDGAGGSRTGGCVHAMFLADDPPIAGGRELCGFP